MSPRARDAPWLVVLGLIVAFHIIRGAWSDFAVFAVALLCAVGERPRVGVHVTPRTRHFWVPVAALICGLVLLWAPRHGLMAGLVTGGIGVYAFTLALGSHQPRDAPWAQFPTGARRALRHAVVAWACIIVLAGLWEATAYLTWRWGALPSDVMPSVSDLIDPLIDTQIGKAIFLLAWLAGGVALSGRLRPAERRAD